MKLKKILAGAMAMVMVASSLLVTPVETKATPIVEEPELSGYGWWPHTAYAKSEAITVEDGDTVVWTIDVNANVGGDGAIYAIESGDANGFVDFSSYFDCWGDNVTDKASTLAAANYTLIQAGNKYEVTLTREGNKFSATHKNLTTDTVIIEQSLSVTDCVAAPTFYLHVCYGEMNYEIEKNGVAVDASTIRAALRGYDWWKGMAASKSVPVALVDGGEIVWTLDVEQNIGGDGAIYVLESLDSNGRVYFSSYNEVDGDAQVTNKVTSFTAADFTKIQAGNDYTVTLKREGNVLSVEHKNITTNTVVATQSATITDCPESSTFYIYVMYGEMDCSITIPMKSIEVSGANNKMVAGSELQLSAAAFPANTTDDYTITWSSSDTSKATVDNTGKVTGVAEGNVTITAKVSDTIVDTYDVEVQALAIPLTAIDVTADKTEIELKDTANLTVTYNPEDTTDSKTVTWSSSNEKVLTVKDGVVTAVGYGKATITAKVGEFTDTVEITVLERPATAIDAKADKTELKVGETATITTTVTPANTTDAITYTSSDATIASVDNTGKVTAVGAGKATITVTAGDVTKEIKFTITETSKIELGDLTVDGFWSAHTAGVKIEAGKTYTITFDAKSTDKTNAWNCPSYVIYTNSAAKVDNNSADYKEYIVCRADNWAWTPDGDSGAGTLGDGYKFETIAVPDSTDWVATYKDTMNAGTEGTITAVLSGKNLVVTYKCAGVESKATIPVDTSKPVYFSLTGEKVAVEDITVVAKTIPAKGDVSMVLPFVLVLFGGAVVIVAAKKRFA